MTRYKADMTKKGSMGTNLKEVQTSAQDWRDARADLEFSDLNGEPNSSRIESKSS